MIPSSQTNGFKIATLTVLTVVWLLTACVPPSTGLECPDDPVARASRHVPSFAPFEKEPKGRVGSIPCPGPLTFFVTADPERLGTHAYGNSGRESDRGIVYTRHGGFIDIAHVRKVVDWTAFHQVRIRHALNEGWHCIVLPSKEGSVFRVRFRRDVPRPAIDELSLRLAQRLAITQTAWHEIATWFGYSCSPYPERPSALTYDDMTSHVLGAKIAGLALRQGSGNFNSAVTYYLKRELDQLGAVSPEQTMKALGMVENQWWRGGFVIKRQIDIGESGRIDPWLVPGYPGGGTAGAPFVIPSLKDVAGRDMSGFEQVEIDPNMGVWAGMRRVLPGNPERCQPEMHFPLLMRCIRQYERSHGSTASPP